MGEIIERFEIVEMAADGGRFWLRLGGEGKGVVCLENGNHKLVIIDVIPNRTNLCYIEIEGKINFPGWVGVWVAGLCENKANSAQPD